MTIEKVYWDSDCFLAHLKAENGKVDQCDGVILRAERGDVLIVTSALTIAEVLWMRDGPRLTKDKAAIVQKFFRRSYIRVVNVNRKISEAAQFHVWDSDIRPKDAIHVATAISFGCDALETFDKALIAKSGKVGAPLLLIREPEAAAQSRMNFTPADKSKLSGS
jgi:predicted nucleic acid-binding protein